MPGGQVPGVQVPGARCTGVRDQVPGVRCLVPGAKDQVARDHVSGLRYQCHIKMSKIFDLNGNYKLTNTFFTTLIFSEIYVCNT